LVEYLESKIIIKYGIVTGSSRGIGLATVKLLSEDENLQLFGSSTSGDQFIKSTLFLVISVWPQGIFLN